ncbi:MAG: PAS domain S-box protein, partial [Nitrospinae bacterium]|nr:PAS domain S-box protein [Nitrospinota bacterium]
QYVNPAFERVTGYSASAVVGLTPRLVKSGRQPDEFYRDMWRTITARQPWRGHLVNRRKDGTLYEEAMTISPVLDERGDVAHFVAVKRDISGERALARAHDYFAAVTSHELRTPLTKLKLAHASLGEACGGCCDGPALDSLTDALSSAYASLERVVNTSELFTDLLLKRADQPKTAVDLAAIARDCVESARSHARREGRKVEIELRFAAPGEPLPVLCHQAMIHDALFELMSNAVKYTPDGAAAVVYAGRDGDEAAVCISDEGIGIPRDSLLMVLEPFFSLEDTHRHSSSQFQFLGGGLGMGLTLARLVAEHHGGKLTVESEGEGAGAVISLRLPMSL